MYDLISHIVLYFFFYSFIGWVWETIWCWFVEKRLTYRGFLAGPYCPVYGFGVLTLLYILTPFQSNPIALFLVALLVMTAIEYFVSYILEKLFRTRWWDYSHEKFNINGRISLQSSLFWGFMSVAIVYAIHPQIMALTDAIVAATDVWAAAAVVFIMLTDATFTIIRLSGVYKVVRVLERELIELGEKRLLALKEIAAALTDRRPNKGMRFTERRIVSGLPSRSARTRRSSASRKQ